MYVWQNKNRRKAKCILFCINILSAAKQQERYLEGGQKEQEEGLDLLGSPKPCEDKHSLEDKYGVPFG